MAGAGARTRAFAVCAVAFAAIVVSAPWSMAALGAPEITGPGQGSLHAGAPPDLVKVKGTAPPGASVEVYEGVTLLGGATAGSGGSWSRSFSFSDGTHTIFAIAQAGGDTSPPSPTVTFEVDAKRPGVGISAPADGHVYHTGDEIVVRGQGSDDRDVFAFKVEYWLGTKSVHRALAECTGCGTSSATWSHEPPTFDAGYYVAKAQAIDRSGNHSEAKSVAFFAGVPDAQIPDLGVPSPELPDPPVIREPDPGETVPGTGGTTVIGRGEPGTTIKIFDSHDGALGTVETNGRGRWSARLKLPSGEYEIRAFATDDEGNVSPVSKLIEFYVDADRPVLSILTGDDTAFLPTQPVVIEGTLFDEQRLASVYVEYWLLNQLVLADKARCVGCKEQDAVWSDKPKLTQPGYYYARVKAFDAAGNPSYVATTTFVKTV